MKSSIVDSFASCSSNGILENLFRIGKSELLENIVPHVVQTLLILLCALKYAIERGEEANWNGPDGATYDIETDERFIEVKSSINRGRREVTISNQFQLHPPGKKLDLILCCFEPSIVSGVSIDSVIQEFFELGYNTNLLNRKLETRGFERGMSARKKKFLLHEMLLYPVKDDFPCITPESFIGGVLPEGINKISYTVDLSGMTPVSLLRGETDDIQNN